MERKKLKFFCHLWRQRLVLGGAFKRKQFPTQLLRYFEKACNVRRPGFNCQTGCGHFMSFPFHFYSLINLILLIVAANHVLSSVEPLRGELQPATAAAATPRESEHSRNSAAAAIGPASRCANFLLHKK